MSILRDAASNALEVQVDNIHDSLLIYQANHFIAEMHQANQACPHLGEAMLTTPMRRWRSSYQDLEEITHSVTMSKSVNFLNERDRLNLSQFTLQIPCLLDEDAPGGPQLLNMLCLAPVSQVAS